MVACIGRRVQHQNKSKSIWLVCVCVYVPDELILLQARLQHVNFAQICSFWLETLVFRHGSRAVFPRLVRPVFLLLSWPNGNKVYTFFHNIYIVVCAKQLVCYILTCLCLFGFDMLYDFSLRNQIAQCAMHMSSLGICIKC